ncbi:hypothetical protein MNBD_CHLOROFLEXI01-2680 [hydrothermal vent metagenome]|uniref:TolB protein, periplasmic protein involved in the tonb-independent uptake of group A colicins n=1 Tax=hydrothermal vent metagenome TaxID=652676 RepID=A0A3B0ULU6_9ZZZZ
MVCIDKFLQSIRGIIWLGVLFFLASCLGEQSSGSSIHDSPSINEETSISTAIVTPELIKTPLLNQVLITPEGNLVEAHTSTPTYIPIASPTLTSTIVQGHILPTTSRIERVNLTYDGLQLAGSSAAPSISANGQFVAFVSSGANFVDGKESEHSQVFVRDRKNGTTEIVSVNDEGVMGNQASGVWVEQGSSTSISGNGRYVTFHSFATNLVPDTPPQANIFVYDRHTKQIKLITGSANGDSMWPILSEDGLSIVFISEADNLVPDDTNQVRDIFVYNQTNDNLERVSLATNGVEANAPSGNFSFLSVSANGRFIAFDSFADNLVPDDTNNVIDVFVYDRQTKEIERISKSNNGVEANGESIHPSLSADGRYIAFQSVATNLVNFDTEALSNIFIYDREKGLIQLVELYAGSLQEDVFNGNPDISSSGRWVVFTSNANDPMFEDSNYVSDIFLYDSQTEESLILSVSDQGEASNGLSIAPVLSANECTVVFWSLATNLISDDTNQTWDIFVRDLDGVCGK